MKKMRTQKEEIAPGEQSEVSKRPAAGNFVTGQVQLEIAYFAKSGSLTVHLLRCTQLAAVSRRRTTSNPYVKLYLLPDRSKQGKRKSRVMRHQLEPQFDERFTFGPLQLAEFEARCLWLSVWHKDRGLGRNEFLGELLLPLAELRRQLLSGDLCQSTAPRWYQLKNRPPTPSGKLAATSQSNSQQQQQQLEVGRQQALTTKRVPQSNRQLSMRLAQPAPRLEQQRAAELVAKKLGEFEQKAARLAAQQATSGGNQTNCEPSAGSQKSRAPLEVLKQQQSFTHKDLQTLAADYKCMQVAPPNGLAEHYQAAGQGQLFVALKFVPDSGDLRRSAHMEGQLLVLIKEARDLAHDNHSSAPSSYCKCYLLDARGQRQAKQKTAVAKRTSSPRWDHECRFAGLQLAQLSAQAIEIVLHNRSDSVAASLGAGNAGGGPADGERPHLGAIRLCRRLRNEPAASHLDTDTPALADLCSEREARLWIQMLARPNIWVYGELPLKRRLCPLVALSSGQSSEQMTQ